MIYVVSGMIRSGTSMVMAALRAGGMSVYWDQQHEADLRAKYPQERNPGGYWEPSPDERVRMDFPLQAKGKAIKILAPWLTLGIMAPAEYRVVIIRRNPHEIGASIVQLLQEPLSRGDQHILANYDKRIAKAVAVCENRKDVRSVCVLDYGDILENPVESFDKLVEQDWPIDVDRAAGTIDSGLRTCVHRERVTA